MCGCNGNCGCENCNCNCGCVNSGCKGYCVGDVCYGYGSNTKAENSSITVNLVVQEKAYTGGCDKKPKCSCKR